jgi:enoyl-CoA hydratase
MSSQFVESEVDSGVLHVRLNRPDRLNAVSEEMYRDLHATLDLAESTVVGSVLLSGAGRAFCAGADLKAHASRPRTTEERRAYVWSGQHFYRRLRRLDQPVVVAVHGHAVGAGAELALCGDVILCADDAVLRLPEIELGSFVGGGVTHRLPQLIGAQRAAALLLLGQPITGAQAAQWGMAMESVVPDRLLDRALEVAHQLASRPAEPMRRAVHALRSGARLSLDDALGLEGDALLSQMASAEWQHGVDRFQAEVGP